MSDNNLRWYVALQKNNKIYYAADADSKEGTVMWTSNRSQALTFITEASIGEFVSKVLHNRTDIYLVIGPDDEKD